MNVRTRSKMNDNLVSPPRELRKIRTPKAPSKPYSSRNNRGEYKWIIHCGRKIIVVNRQPYYQSSGSSSGLPGTWFPFFGISEDGWFIKKVADPTSIRNILEIFGIYIHIRATDQLCRFGSEEDALISASIGTGYWEVVNRRHRIIPILKRYHLPKRICLTRKPDIHESIRLSHDDVNQWIIKQGGICKA